MRHYLRLSAAILILTAGTAWAHDGSCRAAIGAQRAATLVRQCIDVSPATHPPCNVANPCEMIIDEIARGCRMLDEDRIAHPGWRMSSAAEEPRWCERYLGNTNRARARWH